MPPSGSHAPKPRRRAPTNGIREILREYAPRWLTRDEIITTGIARWGRDTHSWERALDRMIQHGELTSRREEGILVYQSIAEVQRVPTSSLPEDVDQEEPADAPAQEAAPRPALAGHEGLIQDLTRRRRQVAYVRELPARAPQYAPKPAALPLEVVSTLGTNFQFYSHQARAIDAALHGENLVVATGTSSGKSTCYNAPVLASILKNKNATALYVFPTKALAQDQLKTLKGLAQRLPSPAYVATYDGDTPTVDRDIIKRGQGVNVVLTNPDMMNVSILPYHHGTWRWFFERLKFVVIDEVHTYKGIFGSHMANLLRRLRRIAQYHGANPQFIACSATIANPREFAEKLVGAPFTLIDNDGGPQGERTVVFWNPAIVREGIIGPVRASSIGESATLFSEHVRRRVRTINFAKSRKLCEIIVLEAQGKLEDEHPHLTNRISPYRAGYKPEERRDIEARLKNGDLLGVVSTSALELGVDIGHLEAAIITGFPGTMASFWQMAGRAGRSGKKSAITFVADEDALNQYWMNNPEEFFQRTPEHAILNPDNPYILDEHVACLIKENPPKSDTLPMMGPGFSAALERLSAKGLIEKSQGAWRWRGSYDPHQRMSIRSLSNLTYSVVDERGNDIEEPAEEERAFRDFHPNAVHYHLGETFVVQDIDLKHRRIILTRGTVDYSTESVSSTDVTIKKTDKTRKAGAIEVHLGDVDVTRQVTAYVRLNRARETIGKEELELPSTTLPTKALWFTLPEDLETALREGGHDIGSAAHAAEHALIAVTPILAMCDRWDLGGVSYGQHPTLLKPAIFLYDGHPGGVGITATDHENFDELVRRALKLVTECPCKTKDGCPGCVHSPKCGNRNESLDKRGAIVILESLRASAS